MNLLTQQPRRPSTGSAGLPVPLPMAIKVSIVEDDDWIRENLAAQISHTQGFVCSGSYRSGEAAVERLGAHPPDRILMDINLPKMSGIDCVRSLKTLVPTAQ